MTGNNAKPLGFAALALGVMLAGSLFLSSPHNQVQAQAVTGPVNQVVGSTPYPYVGNNAAVPILSVASGTTGAVTATLAAAAGKTTYICGIDISAAGGSATISPITISSLAVGTWTIQGISSGSLPVYRNFTPCIPAQTVNTVINIVTTADGTATAVNVQAWGYQL